MSLIGAGALTNWHDVRVGAHKEFNAWHTHEHQAERLRVPGFLRGRRYAALEGNPHYFVLYETETVEVLGSPAYVERLNNPTAWTQKMNQTYERTVRVACRVEKSYGKGLGGVVATCRLQDTSVDDEVELLTGLVNRWGILSVHLLAGVPDVTGIATAEKRARPTPDETCHRVLLLEGIGRSEVAEAAAALLDSLQQEPDHGIYGLQNLMLREDG